MRLMNGKTACHPTSPEGANYGRMGNTFLVFGLTMLGLALILPFVYANRPLDLWTTVGQILTWAAFTGSLMRLGYLLESAGHGLVPQVAAVSPPRRYGSVEEIMTFSFGLLPSCFGYLFFSYRNTEYLGFNFLLLFIVSGQAVNYFPMWLVLVVVAIETLSWSILARALFGVWLPVDNLLQAASGFLFSVMMFFLLRKERHSRFKAEALSRKLDAANDQLREYSAQIEELAATQERNRIAREIHDTLGHSLTVVNMQLETARALLSADVEKASGFIEKAQTMTKKGLSDVRASVASLRSSPLSGKSLEQSLQGLLDAARSAGLETEFSVSGEPRPLPEAVERAFFRTAQEGLTNIGKHARARRVNLGLEYLPDRRVTLRLRDDGVGCASPDGGFGLVGIRERIQMLDGRTEIRTAPGEGLELSVSVVA